ncbi:phosphate signaling complex protein PhoU [Companilactobacillus mishanensis]|uniref:Phosphate-specific transport system accessory protein PhoU n=1 Tax=Companilactobacillus mishanensis TaxID=2486008 RepID=A0A5P0ZFS8_9LACO|nr:phosphate signaling complex protein PhoU [Companilactobacillus mishanensis]MQS45660.1 phosphate signaling complex protein PhoU [Companilactobacillus mishanensis]MQS51907.1 phosphate signaling complex protein PhoU [Companilactobacillus mishanensis]MQS88978.1 phosphate signaling complex protein PhoU [Companilactobacillus mishanensis]
MRSTFEEQLNNLHLRFSEMGMMASEAIMKSVKAYINHDKALAKEVIENDRFINKREVDLEKKSFEMIALQQPVTSDLRMVVTVLKASSDLERMGDHAVSIAQETIRVKGTTRIPEIEKLIAEMGDMATSIVEDSLEAYLKEDGQMAEDVAAKDGDIDKRGKLINDMCIKDMQQSVDNVISGSSYMLVESYLERVGDYATNICEWVVYLNTGHVVELSQKHVTDTEE